MSSPMPCDEKPLVSVLLPVFNGGAGLREAVMSILGQTMSNFELLIIDDGSSDGAIERLGLSDDPRIHFMGGSIRQGLSARLNEGILAAQGRYIARMDADDIAFPERLEKQSLFLNSNPTIDLIGCRMIIFRDPENIIGLHPFAEKHADICAQPWRGFPLPHPTWFGRKDWFMKHPYRLPEVKRAEDQDLLLHSYQDSHFASLDEVLLGYRQRHFNLANTWHARQSLLSSQRGYFIKHRQYHYAVLACIFTFIKMVIDLLASLPGCESLYFMRMRESVPDPIIRAFKCLRVAL